VSAAVARLRAWAKTLKRDVVALHLAARDPHTPLGARILALAVLAYALSPLDLIPDFIPILGQLDDVILVPLGIWLVVRMIPREVFTDARARAQDMDLPPASRAGATVIVTLWIAGLAVCLWWILP
jgi:uncharacterized membrane protein YkvA (DUF1232 family)